MVVFVGFVGCGVALNSGCGCAKWSFLSVLSVVGLGWVRIGWVRFGLVCFVRFGIGSQFGSVGFGSARLGLVWFDSFCSVGLDQSSARGVHLHFNPIFFM